MPYIISRQQYLRTGVMYPRGVYSRVVSCGSFIRTPDTLGFAYTVRTGINVWLLGVKIWFTPEQWQVTDKVYFSILTGTGEPRSRDEILRWTNVLPMLIGGTHEAGWGKEGPFIPFEWEMNQLFTGEGRRFGVAVEVTPLVSVLWTYVSFQISEG